MVRGDHQALARLGVNHQQAGVRVRAVFLREDIGLVRVLDSHGVLAKVRAGFHVRVALMRAAAQPAHPVKMGGHTKAHTQARQVHVLLDVHRHIFRRQFDLSVLLEHKRLVEGQHRAQGLGRGHGGDVDDDLPVLLLCLKLGQAQHQLVQAPIQPATGHAGKATVVVRGRAPHVEGEGLTHQLRALQRDVGQPLARAGE